MNYEEAIKDVKELSNLAEWYESDVIGGGYEEAKKHREDMTQRVIKFIKKEHELLGLKNKLIEALGNENSSIAFAFYTVALHKEIRYKEKELEEMK